MVYKLKYVRMGVRYLLNGHSWSRGGAVTTATSMPAASAPEMANRISHTKEASVGPIAHERVEVLCRG